MDYKRLVVFFIKSFLNSYAFKKYVFSFISIFTQTRKYGCPRRPILSPFGYGSWCKQQLFGMTSIYWNWQNLLSLKLYKRKHIKGLRKKRWMLFMRLTTTELKRKQKKKMDLNMLLICKKMDFFCGEKLHVVPGSMCVILLLTRLFLKRKHDCHMCITFLLSESTDM